MVFRKNGGGDQSWPTEYKGGDYRYLTANKLPMGGGGIRVL